MGGAQAGVVLVFILPEKATSDSTSSLPKQFTITGYCTGISTGFSVPALGGILWETR